jgi:hypothetical protein
MLFIFQAEMSLASIRSLARPPSATNIPPIKWGRIALSLNEPINAGFKVVSKLRNASSDRLDEPNGW